MLDPLISLIAPHRCIACLRTGSVLCMACVAYITDERTAICMICAKMCDESGLCSSCAPGFPAERALIFGERSGVLERLVNDFKFARKRAAYRPIAALLANLLPYRLGPNVQFVPLPTIARHVRQRGYDHTALIARCLAGRYGGLPAPVLMRSRVSVQRGASKAERTEQARVAFSVRQRLDPEKLYILIDDVVTTGASVRFASQVLKDAGATRV